MKVLRLFAPDRPELTATEVSRLCGWPRSSAARLLSALEESGFLDRDDLTGRYRIGLRLAALGSLAVYATSLQRVARPELELLARTTGETANISVLSGTEVVNVGLVLSPRPIKHMGWIGRRMPIHATAAGKALVAWRADDLSELIAGPLRSCTARTITSPARLSEELARVRERGWSDADREYEEDLVGIGAPVRDHAGGVIACVTISAPAFRMAPERMPEIGPQVRAAADRISTALGHVPTTVMRGTAAEAAR